MKKNFIYQNYNKMEINKMELKLPVIVLFTILATGCATTKNKMYSYGDYSENFYAMKKDTNADTSLEWKSTLEDIITNSKLDKLRVPPGVYANLGYIYLQANKTEKAVFFFHEEKEVYPESAVFMDNLIKKAEVQG